MNLFTLENKTILVTGASSGIGRAVAVLCSKQGAKLILTARNKGKLEETLGLLTGDGHEILIADLNNTGDVEKLISSIPALDGFVNNAGIVLPLLLQFTESEDVDKVLNTNAISAIQLTRMLVQEKKLKKQASLIYMSSVNGNKCSSPGSTLYAASKAMLTGFAKALALELAPKGIRVNTIEPGMIETDIFKDSAVAAEEMEADKQKYPLKRYGKPDEVAASVVFLLSDASKWITGSQLLIDGGFTLL